MLISILICFDYEDRTNTCYVILIFYMSFNVVDIKTVTYRWKFKLLFFFCHKTFDSLTRYMMHIALQFDILFYLFNEFLKCKRICLTSVYNNKYALFEACSKIILFAMMRYFSFVQHFSRENII